MTTTATKFTTTADLAGCPTWCEDHGQPHEVVEFNHHPGGPTPRQGRPWNFSVMHHARRDNWWSVDAMAFYDREGRLVEIDEAEVSPDFEWVTTATDVGRAAAALLAVADSLGAPVPH